MHTLSIILVALVAIEHFYIAIMEMFMWTHSRTLQVFGFEKAFAEKTKSLAANQGLYNGFLAMGLVLGLFHHNEQFAVQIQLYLLACILVAAVFGCFTVKRSILFVQGVPALFALLSLLLLG